MGVKYYYSSGSAIGGLWPYWISAGGLACRPFWDHYLATGDEDFLRNRVVPAYKDLALFYEDFLTATDKNGNYIFAPSFSPENTPASTDPSGPVLVNATMDIAVCREVLTNLIQACETLGVEADSVPKWKAMLAKMPPYLLELDGTLKEWAWPTLQEHYSHRHVSHLYGAWPGDEIDPDRTPQLARAAVIADRRRTFDVMSTAVSGETLPAYARCHRALVGARLKDNVIVDVQLRQLLEQGYVSTALRCSREPYGRTRAGCAGRNSHDHHGNAGLLAPRRDRSASRPSALAGQRIDQRNAGPHLREDRQTGLGHGGANRGPNDHVGAKARRHFDCPARDRRDLRACRRFGGEAPAGRANCDLHLPEGKPVEIHLKLGRRNPLDWAAGVA